MVTKEEREIRSRYPYLSNYGVRQAMRPTDFCVSYVDDALYAQEVKRRDGAEDCIDIAKTMKDIDARTLPEARRLARRVLTEQPLSSPTIYRRKDIWRSEDRASGLVIPQWHCEDFEWVEDVLS